MRELSGQGAMREFRGERLNSRMEAAMRDFRG